MVKSQDNELQSNWGALLDELKTQDSLSSDAKLAETLGVTRGYLCSVRKGRKKVSLDLAKKIFSKLGRTFETESFERLFVPVDVRRYTSYLGAIRRNVILRADGHCQLCGIKAPFKDRTDFPFLEVHHVVSVADGGSEDISNLVALCPNCHRKIHMMPSSEDKKKLDRLSEQYSEKSS